MVQYAEVSAPGAAQTTPAVASSSIRDEWAEEYSSDTHLKAQLKQVQAELHVAQLTISDVFKDSAELCKKTEVAIGEANMTPPVMAYLLNSLRHSQDTVNELVKTASAYNLSSAELDDFKRLIAGNNAMVQPDVERPANVFPEAVCRHGAGV